MSIFAGRYEVERVLGEGATAVVYLARDTQGGKPVAIKWLRPELAESSASARFLREIRRTSELDHPRILRVLDSGQEQGRPYFTLPYMDGGTLRQRLSRQRQCDVGEAIVIARKVAEALEHAHERGLVHRDVKPENILFADAEPHLSDFGIARALQQVYGETTSSNVVRGTPAYMSPEQAAGSERLDGRSDQFALACVFYEMVAGIPAYVGPSAESVIAQRFHHPPRPIRVYRPSVSSSFESALSRAFAVQPADRYPTVTAFVDALEDSFTHAAPIPEPSRRRRRYQVAAALTGLVVLGYGMANATGLLGGSEAAAGTSSLRARRALVRGQALVQRWQLDSADARFREALEWDPGYAQAALELAQIRMWKRDSVSRWSFAAELAAANAPLFSANDRLRSEALVLQSRGRRPEACDAWRRLTREDQFSFVSWYGLGTCLRFDDVVVVDRSSATGWRFRSSYNEAMEAYERAFRLMPAIHQSLAPNAFEDVRRLLMASGEAIRRGRGLAPDTTRFLAYPAWHHDSLAFLPQPREQFLAGPSVVVPAFNEAVARQRWRFHQVAQMWRASLPQSVAAIEAVAVSLDLMGHPGARDTLALARSRAVDRRDRIRTGVMDVWLRVKSAVPHDADGLMAARRLADSLLAVYEPRNQAEARMLVSLAALTGRGRLAAEFARRAEGPSTPLPVATLAPALEIYAAMGGPVDSVHFLERQLEGAMGRLLGAEAGVVRSNWLIRSASLAIPVHHFEHLPVGAGNASSRLRLVEAWHARDLARARIVLDDVRLQRQRALVRPFDIAIDGLYSEAATLMALGDPRGALEWAAPTLDSLAFATAASLSTGARAATLVRAMALRADGENSVGDRRRAADWARSAMILWSSADASYQPLVDRMRRMSPAP